jgi:spermidine synthase
MSAPGGADPSRAQPAGLGLELRIFLVSVFGLALEVALIRWISTEIRIFAYFKNLTLIACFFGLGLGCLVGSSPGEGASAKLGRRLRFWWTFPILLGLCAVVTIPKHLGYDFYGTLTAVLGRFNEMPLWTWGTGETASPASWFALLWLVLLFLWITILFVPAGQLLGAWMEQAPNKFRAYSVNVLGSLVGIGWFTVVSFLALPPAVWFVTTLLPACALVVGLRERALAILGTAAIGVLFLLTTPAVEEVHWSPYQKLAVSPLTLRAKSGPPVPAGYLVRVNEAFYQRISSFDRAYLAANRELFPEGADSDYLGYNVPYRIVQAPERVLIVGAGTGNDVAAALRNGAGHVDAVEIDPEIVSIGRALHPEKPYDDPRVSVHVDDARSFFNHTHEHYDMVVFGALDSHALSSSLSNIRLDNYVYTVESFAAARELLKDDGLMVVVFSAERQFILQRLEGMLTRAFGHAPFYFQNLEIRALGPAGGGPTLLIDRQDTVAQRIRNGDARLASAVLERQQILEQTGIPLATDDWPYLYLERRTIPQLYLAVMGALVVVALLLVRPFIGHVRRLDPHFFLLGAAFLLVEVQGISKMALLFGTTWLVNAIVLSAIMIMILLANAVAPRLNARRLAWAYAALFASLLLSYAWPAASLLALSGATKVVASGALLTLPVFFAGLIFVTTFAACPHPGAALGANLFGALLGGALESTSFVIGVGALALLALALYGGSLAVILARRR